MFICMEAVGPEEVVENLLRAPPRAEVEAAVEEVFVPDRFQQV